MTERSATRVGRGRWQAKAGRKRRAARRVRMMKVDQFASRKTRTSSSEDTGGRPQPSGCKQGPLGGCLFLTSQVTCLRESCMRENRTCSLGGGRRLARKRASFDPTIQNGVRGSGEWYAGLEGQLRSMTYLSCPKTSVFLRLQLTHSRRSRFTDSWRPKSHDCGPTTETPSQDQESLNSG